jgi:hypothetical protein
MNKLVLYTLSENEVRDLVYKYLESKGLKPIEVQFSEERIGIPFCMAYTQAEEIVNV